MTWLANPRHRLFLGAPLISLSPVWVRIVDVSPTTSGFYRVLFGGAALVIYMLVTSKRLELSKNAWRMLIIASVFLALDLWLWHRSIIYIGPGLSTLLANFQVFIMMVAGFLLFKEKPPLQQIIAAPLAMLGLAMIVGFDWSGMSEDYQYGLIFGFLTAVVYAGYLLTLRHARKGSSYRMPTREMAAVSIMTVSMLALVAVVEGESLAIPTYKDFGWLVAYGVLSHCIGWLFIASSLPEVTAVDAGLALLLQPTLSFVWDIVFFARPMTPIELVGAAIALFAIYLGSRSSSKQA